jgi:hypothetical protein
VVVAAQNPLDGLTAAVRSSDRTEDDCGRFLRDHFLSVLLPTDAAVTLVNHEYTTDSGRVDLVIICKRIELDSTERQTAYVWELKAPQIHLFESVNGSRARPSDELFLAENQLLHYHDSLASSEKFRRERGITSTDDVLIGGIVMGRDDCFTRASDAGMKHLANSAYECRKKQFYRACGLQLVNWDQILRKIPMLVDSHRNVEPADAS